MVYFGLSFSSFFKFKKVFPVFCFTLAGVSLCIVSLLFTIFDRSYGSYQFIQILNFWRLNGSFGFLGFGIDGISLCLVFLTSLIFALCFLTVWKIDILYTNQYCFLLLSLFIFLVFSFIVLDIFSFFCLFESVLIPMFLIIGLWGTVYRKVYASLLFVIYTLLGSIFIFFSLFVLYYEFGTFSFSLISKCNIAYTKQLMLCFFIFLTFSVKIPMVPFHIWLPEAHVEAPSVGSVVLASILLKLGSYGFIRILFPFFTEALYYFTPIIYMLSLLGIFYAAITAIRQVDLKRIIAYSSISHMNLIVLGIFSYSLEGLVGGCFLMVAHGLVASLFFLLVGFLYDRYGSRLIFYYGGLSQLMPCFSIFLFIACICNIGLPGTCNFIGEFLIFLGLVVNNKMLFLLSLLSIILSPLYSIYLYNKLCFGNLSYHITVYHDLNIVEIIISLALLFFSLVIGVWPFFVIDVLNSTCYLFIEK